MEFDSPEVQKEFPGLYAKPDCEMGDPADCKLSSVFKRQLIVSLTRQEG